MPTETLPFVPDSPLFEDCTTSIIRCSSDDKHHLDLDGQHDKCCWAVGAALDGRRHRRIDLLLKDLEDTAWLVPPMIALILTVLDPRSPYGVLWHWSDGLTRVWWNNGLYERGSRGALTFIEPMRWTS